MQEIIGPSIVIAMLNWKPYGLEILTECYRRKVIKMPRQVEARPIFLKKKKWGTVDVRSRHDNASILLKKRGGGR
jgi:hypothetical protein